MHREMVMEFRTPQHPSMGTNSWGGASPMLARDIPKESLEQRYRMLNSIRHRDEIFPAMYDDDFSILDGDLKERERTAAAPPAPPSRRGLLARLMMRRRRAAPKPEPSASATLGVKKRRWFGRWDPQNRWPQGWC